MEIIFHWWYRSNTCGNIYDVSVFYFRIRGKRNVQFKYRRFRHYLLYVGNSFIPIWSDFKEKINQILMNEYLSSIQILHFIPNFPIKNAEPCILEGTMFLYVIAFAL